MSPYWALSAASCMWTMLTFLGINCPVHITVYIEIEIKVLFTSHFVGMDGTAKNKLWKAETRWSSFPIPEGTGDV